MIASVEGVVGAVAMDSLVIEVGGIGYRVFAAPAIIAAAVPGGRLKLHTYHLVREDQQALYGFRNADEMGFFTLLLTVTGVGPKVALAIVGSRPDGRPPARDPGPGPGRARGHPGHRQEARRADHLRAQGEGHRGRRRRSPARPRPARRRARARSSPRCRRSAIRSARRARRHGWRLADLGVASTLEERVKAALRSLVRD